MFGNVLGSILSGRTANQSAKAREAMQRAHMDAEYFYETKRIFEKKPWIDRVYMVERKENGQVVIHYEGKTNIPQVFKH